MRKEDQPGPQGILPIRAYTKMLGLKGVPSGFTLKVYKRVEISLAELCKRAGTGGGGRRGMGLRNDILITCKAVTSRVGQRIIVACFPQ